MIRLKETTQVGDIMTSGGDPSLDLNEDFGGVNGIVDAAKALSAMMKKTGIDKTLNISANSSLKDINKQLGL